MAAGYFGRSQALIADAIKIAAQTAVEKLGIVNADTQIEEIKETKTA